MANIKISALTADTEPQSTDIVAIVDELTTIPNNKKVTLTNVIKKAHGLSDSTIIGIYSGVMTSGIDVAITDGGTGASNASGARTNLGLVIGTDVVAPNADTTGKSAKTDSLNTATTPVNVSNATAPSAGQVLKATDATHATWQTLPTPIVYGDAVTTNPLSQFASTTSLQLKNTISDETGTGALVFANSPALVTPTGLIKSDVGLGNVTNNAQYYPTGTDVAVTDGGTGASDASTARTNLGLVIGTDVVAPNQDTTGKSAKTDALNSATTVVNVSSATAPTTGQVLKATDSTHATWQTLPASQATYDIVVAPSGGDYTTLSSAIAGAVAGSRILVKEGTYTETGWTSTLANLRIDGENAINTILNFTTTSITHTGARFYINNVNINFTTGGMNLNAINPFIDNCILVKTGDTNAFIVCNTTGMRLENSTITSTMTVSAGQLTLNFAGNSTLKNNIITLTNSKGNGNGNAIELGTNSWAISNNIQVTNNSTSAFHTLQLTTDSTCIGNKFNADSAHTGAFCVVIGDRVRIADNVLTNATTNAIGVRVSANVEGLIINDNYIKASTSIYYTNSGTNGLITGNKLFATNGSVAISLDSNTVGTTIIGNIFANDNAGAYAVMLPTNATAYTTFTGNHFVSVFTTPFLNSTSIHNITGNFGLSNVWENKTQYLKNTSGGTLTAGTLVVSKATASADEITTTTTTGDHKILGVVLGSITNNSYGYVQTLGKTTTMKVNGQTDIAIGDFITSYTSAGIGQKASTNDMSIAIALTAYTANDSLGVIDALLITQRVA
ncbi:MAG: hypothetical protein WCJ60_01600 [bacterium]